MREGGLSLQINAAVVSGEQLLKLPGRSASTYDRAYFFVHQFVAAFLSCKCGVRLKK